jgi:hypothetical protein
MAKKKKDEMKDMMDVMQIGIGAGIASSVIGQVTPSSGIGKTVGLVGQAAITLGAVDQILKKMDIED